MNVSLEQLYLKIFCYRRPGHKISFKENILSTIFQNLTISVANRLCC